MEDGGEIASPEQPAAPVDAGHLGGGEGKGAGDDGHHLVLPVPGFAEQGEDTAETERRVWRREEGENLLPPSPHLNLAILAAGDGGTLQGKGQRWEGGALVHVKHPSPGSDILQLNIFFNTMICSDI